MAVLLGFLLVLALAGLAALGYYAIQLHLQVGQLVNAEFTRQTQHAAERKQWTESSTLLDGKYQDLAKKYSIDASKWIGYADKLKADIQRLSKWKTVADADRKAAEMLQAAQATLERANSEASSLLQSTQQRLSVMSVEADQKARAELATAGEKANLVMAEAKERAKGIRDEAQAILNSATTRVATIIEAANKKAEEIAGNAYGAMQNAALYERTAKAMKNLIDGYGDQYIIPEQSLLDDLAANFGHAQAGQELKRAREYTKVMLRSGTAATCEYVEANRRETAVNFVVDAFNGKVDSILSRVKHDNAGKLEQQIRDAFTLVNFNGRAFRDARITDEYLAARLDELKWGVVAQRLAEKEREEQRHAKEQIREEARAAKELERALREAAKEEELLEKAMRQAQEQFEQASGEQKAMYESRLQEMNARLREAMERKDRARSMAEQTKKGHVYIISNIGSFGEGVYKIGLTRRWDPRDRIAELGGASVPFGFDVHALIVSENAPALEQQLHEHFVLKQVNKINHRKEFFRVSLKDVREEIEKLGLTGVAWTMTAEAREYRESLATEAKLQENAALREAWIKRQLLVEDKVHGVFEPVGAFDDE